jgi:hypothetical protein
VHVLLEFLTLEDSGVTGTVPSEIALLSILGEPFNYSQEMTVSNPVLNHDTASLPICFVEQFVASIAVEVDLKPLNGTLPPDIGNYRKLGKFRAKLEKRVT